MTYFIIRTATTLNFPTNVIVFSSSSAEVAEKEIEHLQGVEQESQFSMVNDGFVDVHSGEERNILPRPTEVIDHTFMKNISELMKWVSGKNVIDRRKSLLGGLGFSLRDERTEWNFGRSCDIKPGFYVFTYEIQLGCATGGTAKNGYSINACPVITAVFR